MSNRELGAQQWEELKRSCPRSQGITADRYVLAHPRKSRCPESPPGCSSPVCRQKLGSREAETF
ncbi:hypothetical protein JCGZ_18163 [Jatropha curcas]|uniref:Uncharacterized protein n=1 Tax=Jatropha curcas TaxID=180498 RepID=A0A067K286_JATCU|nr:hypothetical protein JCGZ_18163 [Jatropha curcas]